MNRWATEEVIRQVERRIAQGDCPTIPAFRVSTLEEVIFDLAAENRALRSQSDASPEHPKGSAEGKHEPEPNAYTHPYTRKCDRCGKECRFKEPCLSTVVYCDFICAD
jgi:hypothetical protein